MLGTFEIMEDLEKVNKEIRKQKVREYQRAWRKANPEKKKKQNAEWNKEKRNEYQRAYRAKKK